MRVLLIEDKSGDVLFIQEQLTVMRRGEWELESVSRLSAGLKRLARGGVDVLLIDLGLPDSQGLDTLRRVRAQEPDLPIVVLTGNADDALGLQAIREGAQEFLRKQEVRGPWLVRALQLAIQQGSRSDEETEATSLASIELGVALAGKLSP